MTRCPYPHVTLDSSGDPVITGTRVPVHRLWASHRGGTKIEKLIAWNQHLGEAKVLCALAFAYDNQELVEQALARQRARELAPPAHQMQQIDLIDRKKGS